MEQIRLERLKEESGRGDNAAKKGNGNNTKNACKPAELKNKSYVQLQLIEKDKKIKELTKMVQMYETGKIQNAKSPFVQEVMVIGHENAKEREGEEDPYKKYDADMYKMSRAEFLMAQIDLDPIESNYSQEQNQVSSNLKYRASNMLSAIGSNN